MSPLEEAKEKLRKVEHQVIDQVGIDKALHFRVAMNSVYDDLIIANDWLKRLEKDAELRLPVP